MKAASITEIKKTLVRLDHGELFEACLRLARFKLNNKELLTYLLFMQHDEALFVRHLRDHIDQQFRETPKAHKKTVRKLIRWMNKCARFSKDKESEIQMRIHFCHALRNSKTPFRSTKVMLNMYTGQLKKIAALIEKFDPDIGNEYRGDLKELELS
jgi:hypothetical protein